MKVSICSGLYRHTCSSCFNPETALSGLQLLSPLTVLQSPAAVPRYMSWWLLWAFQPKRKGCSVKQLVLVVVSCSSNHHKGLAKIRKCKDNFEIVSLWDDRHCFHLIGVSYFFQMLQHFHQSFICMHIKIIIYININEPFICWFLQIAKNKQTKNFVLK